MTTAPDYWTDQEFFEFQEDLPENFLELIFLPQASKNADSWVTVQRAHDVVAVVVNQGTNAHVIGIWDLCPVEIMGSLGNVQTLKKLFNLLDGLGVNVSAPWMPASPIY